MDVAATLEVRGFAAPRRSSSTREARRRDRLLRVRRGSLHSGRVRRPFSRHDIAFALSAAFILALAVCARIARDASFAPYPTVDMPLRAATFAFALAIAAAALLPFADRRGIDP